MDNRYKNLLIIEDDKFMQNRLHEILDIYNVTMVMTAEEGLKHFKQLQGEPLLILLDIELPGINGYEACRQIRELDEACTPIIFLSAVDNLDDRVKGYEAGGDDYITKPFNVVELKSKINKVLENKKLNDQLTQQVGDTQSAALSAQTNAAKMGEITQFLQASQFCRDIPSLCQRFFKVTKCFGLKCTVRVSVKNEVIILSDDTHINELEQTILEKALNAGRIYNFGQGRAIFNWGQVSLLVRKIGDEADHLAVLMNGFESSVTALQIERDFVSAIKQIKKSNAELQTNILKKYDELTTELGDAFSRLGITSSLSDFELDQLTDILDENKKSITNSFDAYHKNDEKLSDILKEIELSYQDNLEPSEDDSIFF